MSSVFFLLEAVGSDCEELGLQFNEAILIIVGNGARKTVTYIRLKL